MCGLQISDVLQRQMYKATSSVLCFGLVEQVWDCVCAFFVRCPGAKPRQFDCSCGLKQLLWSTLRTLNWLTRRQCCNACVVEFTSCKGRQCTAAYADFRDHSRNCVSVLHGLSSGILCWQQTKLTKGWDSSCYRLSLMCDKSIYIYIYILPLLLFSFC